MYFSAFHLQYLPILDLMVIITLIFILLNEVIDDRKNKKV